MTPCQVADQFGKVGKTYEVNGRNYICETATRNTAGTKCQNCDCDEEVLDCVNLPECYLVQFKRV